jgi:transposase
MARPIRAVIGGVDTHAATHHAVVVDLLGVLQGSQEFTATAAGYTELLTWLRSHGRIDRVGVEGTGAYGAGLARHLHDKGVSVIEVPRPDRRLRRQRGKSDPIDAEAAARAVLAGTATVKPKLANGSIEAIRAIRVARNGAVKAKTAATNALQALLITAPEPLRAQLRCRSTIKLVETCGGLRPDMARLHDPTQAFKLALRVDQALHGVRAEAPSSSGREQRSILAPATLVQPDAEHRLVGPVRGTAAMLAALALS